MDISNLKEVLVYSLPRGCTLEGFISTVQEGKKRFAARGMGEPNIIGLHPSWITDGVVIGRVEGKTYAPWKIPQEDSSCPFVAVQGVKKLEMYFGKTEEKP